jgi:hypothetical protein
VLALICLFELFPDDDSLLDRLTRLGVCAGRDQATSELIWTDKKRHFDKLM